MEQTGENGVDERMPRLPSGIRLLQAESLNPVGFGGDVWWGMGGVGRWEEAALGRDLPAISRT